MKDMLSSSVFVGYSSRSRVDLSTKSAQHGLSLFVIKIASWPTRIHWDHVPMQFCPHLAHGLRPRVIVHEEMPSQLHSKACH